MKNVLIKLTMFSGVVLLCGCSSVMSHTGGKEGTYPGTRASAAMISDDDTNWEPNLWSSGYAIHSSSRYSASAVGHVPHG